MERAAALGLALAALTAALYAPLLGFDFVVYDDPVYVTENPMVRSGLTWEGLRWALGFQAVNWFPLTWLSHMFDVEIFGVRPGPLHALNLLFHVTSSVLLFTALRWMTARPWPSAFAAALFAWHPIHVESVAWISERKDVLSACFWMAGLAAYARATRGGELERIGPTALWMALGALCKGTLVTLPFALLLLDVWPLRRVQPGRDGWRRWAALLREKWPLFCISAASSVLVWLAQASGGATRGLAAVSLGERLSNALVAYAEYLRMLVWPRGLAVLYPHPATWGGAWPPDRVLLAAGLLALVTLLATAVSLRRTGGRVAWRDERGYALVGWLWFLGTLVPMIGIVSVGGLAWADRYAYIPAIGLYAALAFAAADLSEGSPTRTRLAAFAAALLLAACAVGTRSQLAHWRDSESLLRRAVAVTERNAIMHHNLGKLLVGHGEVEAGVIELQRAVEIRPGLVEARIELGNVWFVRGDLDRAREEYARGITDAAGDIRPEPPWLAHAHYNLGILHLQQGRRSEAERELRRSLELDPDLEPSRQALDSISPSRGLR